MSRPVMAVILSLLCPGLGQIYNREHKRGWALIALTTALFMVPSFWLMRSVAPILQGGMDPLEVQAAMGKVVQENKHPLNLFTFAFMGVWAYSIVQAYFKAKEIADSAEPSGDSD